MPFIIIGIIIALVLIFGGKAIAKKAGALAKKIIKIVVLGYAYMFYMSLVVGWFADTSVFFDVVVLRASCCGMVHSQKADIRKQSEQADHQLHQFCFE